MIRHVSKLIRLGMITFGGELISRRSRRLWPKRALACCHYSVALVFALVSRLGSDELFARCEAPGRDTMLVVRKGGVFTCLPRPAASAASGSLSFEPGFSLLPSLLAFTLDKLRSSININMSDPADDDAARADAAMVCSPC